MVFQNSQIVVLSLLYLPVAADAHDGAHAHLDSLSALAHAMTSHFHAGLVLLMVVLGVSLSRVLRSWNRFRLYRGIRH